MDLQGKIDKKIEFHEDQIKKLKASAKTIKAIAKELDDGNGETRFGPGFISFREESKLADALAVLRNHPGETLHVTKIAEEMPKRKGRKEVDPRQLASALWVAARKENSPIVKEENNMYRAKIRKKKKPPTKKS